MKLFLSSYKFGDYKNEYISLFGENKKIGIIPNALDFTDDIARLKKSLTRHKAELTDMGFESEVLDLKDYFDDEKALRAKLKELWGVWVIGGNTFVLRVAFKLSKFDQILMNELVEREDFVYSGYSAGLCVLQPNLKGLNKVDDPHLVLKAYPDEAIIYNGLGLLNTNFLPHYKSDHPESKLIEKCIDYYEENELPYETIQDGDVIIEEI